MVARVAMQAYTFAREVMIHAFLLYSVCTIGKVSICALQCLFWKNLGCAMLFCLLITILLISYDSTKTGKRYFTYIYITSPRLHTFGSLRLLVNLH